MALNRMGAKRMPHPRGRDWSDLLNPELPGHRGASSAAPFGFFSMYLGRRQDRTDKWIHNVRVFATGGHFDMQAAYNLADPTLQLVYGIFGQPSIFDTYVLPGTMGDMAFTPCPAAPLLSSVSFIYAGSFPFGTCGPLIPTSPTPWFSGPGPAIFFPLTVTFQGVVEETIGDFKVTNGIIWEVK